MSDQPASPAAVAALAAQILAAVTVPRTRSPSSTPASPAPTPSSSVLDEVLRVGGAASGASTRRIGPRPARGSGLTITTACSGRSPKGDR